MSLVHQPYAAFLLAATCLACMSAVVMIGSVYDGDELGARLWAGVFFGSSLAAAWSFWGLM